MRTQRVVSISTQDGKTHRVLQAREPGRSYGMQFMIVFTDAMEMVADNINSVITLKLLFRLPRHLDFVNFKQLRTVEIAAELGTHQGNISRSMAELLQLGIVEREGRGPRTAWRLSSDWGWNGSADQYHAFRAGRMRGKKPPAASIGSRIMHSSGNRAQHAAKKNKPSSTLTLLSPIQDDPSEAA